MPSDMPDNSNRAKIVITNYHDFEPRGRVPVERLENGVLNTPRWLEISSV